MKNFRHEGRLIPCTAPAGGVASSEGVKIGDLFGVAATTAPEGEGFELAVEGVFTRRPPPSMAAPLSMCG